jgi:hypothetical protein
MAIFMIEYDKAVNQNVGFVNAKSALVGAIDSVPSKGRLILKSIEEATGKNNKPVVLLKYEDGTVVELPDYGVTKFRDGKE